MHISGSWILLIFVSVLTALILLLLHLTTLGLLIHQKIPDRPHRRLFLASVSFFITFLAVRLLVASITHHIGPFGYVGMGGRHIHHLVWGIFLLLISGYAELAEVGTSNSSPSILLSRLLALTYGIGAALTLDEFALWLNLDAAAYWSRQGRQSIDAIVLFGALLAMGTWVRRCFAGWISPAQNQACEPACESGGTRHSSTPRNSAQGSMAWVSPTGIPRADRKIDYGERKNGQVALGRQILQDASNGCASL